MPMDPNQPDPKRTPSGAPAAAPPGDAVEALRRRLVERLTARSDTAWTVTSARFIVRRGGRVLCKVGRDAAHVLVEVPVPRDPSVRAALEAAEFVRPAPAGEGDPERWRQACLTDDAQMERLLDWLLGGPGG